MKVFKYLVALADIATGMLGLLFIIFMVTKPAIEKPKADQQTTQIKQQRALIHRLQNEIKELQKLKLSKAQSGTSVSEDENRTEIFLELSRIGVKVNPQSPLRYFDSVNALRVSLRSFSLSKNILLFCDKNVPFERVVQLIDAIKQFQGDVQIGIAALN